MGAKIESELILKNYIVKFEFALRVGDINEGRLKNITVAAYFFFFKFSRKLVILGTVWGFLPQAFFRLGGGLPPPCSGGYKGGYYLSACKLKFSYFLSVKSSSPTFYL